MWHRPDFDSPSVFCRLLDKNKGGYFSIAPPDGLGFTTKQQYLPSSCILQTRYICEEGVVDLVDFFPRPKDSLVTTKEYKQSSWREATRVQEELKKWLVRRVECIRGSLTLGACVRPSSVASELVILMLYRCRNFSCLRVRLGASRHHHLSRYSHSGSRRQQGCNIPHQGCQASARRRL